MLTQQDIKFIANNRKQITEGRTTPITLIYMIAQGVDQWTGEPLETEPLELAVEAVVTEVASGANGTADIVIIQNIAEDQSDIQVSISRDQLEGFENDRPSRLVYMNELYAVQAVDREGIGIMNRLELNARKAVL